MRGRKLSTYTEQPRRFEQDRAAWDERMLARYEAEQDALEAERDRRDGWQLRTDLPRGAPPVSKRVHDQQSGEAA